LKHISHHRYQLRLSEYSSGKFTGLAGRFDIEKSSRRTVVFLEVPAQRWPSQIFSSVSTGSKAISSLLNTRDFESLYHQFDALSRAFLMADK